MVAISIRNIIFITSLALIISCKKDFYSPVPQKPDGINEPTRTDMIKAPISSTYDDKNILEIPSIVEMNEEQRTYLMDIVSSVRSVIDGSSTLESEEAKILGDGEFFWPKDPNEPVMRSKSYPLKNFRTRGIALKLSREDRSKPWDKAGISVTPRNFPIGVFSMNLPERFFHDYVLVNSHQEERPNDRIKNPLIFIFSDKNDQRIFMKLEVRNDVSSLADAYPRSFHLLWIERK